jgi:hypothetical protein
MTSRAKKRWAAQWAAAAAVLYACIFSATVRAQTFFYTEVTKEGRIYVFAVWSNYDAFIRNNGRSSAKVIERPGYGPGGETVVFDSELALNLYNFKHGLPGEHVQSTEPSNVKFPSHQFSGLMFGDYYWYYRRHQDQISDTNPTAVEGQHGLWFRRIYFTYDFAYNEKFSTRFRIEMNSNGDFSGGELVPDVKDAYLRWSYKGKQQLTLGIQPTVTFEWLDRFWGLRHIEKTPADLYRIDSSRDFGLTFGGPTSIKGLTYAAQFGNESSNGSETNGDKILRFEGRYESNPGVALEAFYSLASRPARQDWQTAQGVAGFRKGVARVAAQYLWQERRSGQVDVANQTIAIWSGFGVWDFLPKKADLFVRVDDVKGHRGDLETGLPDAEEIEYWLLSSQSPFTTWILGGEWYLHSSIRVGPNLELVRYAHDPDPSKFPGRRSDSILRFTFFWTF